MTTSDHRELNAHGTTEGLRYYRPELDALRFFAFLGTFLFHLMDYVPTDRTKTPVMWCIGTVGAFGVPVFFLLSAFLITELLSREKVQNGCVHVRAFYVRRMLRIWPLYFAAFYGLALLNYVVPGMSTSDPRAWLAFTDFAGNWWVTFRGWIAGPVDPLWSVSVEEQFYILGPLVIAFAGRRALVAANLVLLVVSYITILTYAANRSSGDHGEWTNSLVHFQFFSAGTLIAVLLRGRLPRQSGCMRLIGVIAGLSLWTIAVTVFQVRSWDPQPTLIGAPLGWFLLLVGTVSIFASILGIPASRIPPWLSYSGRISYGLYVFHSLLLTLTFQYAFSALGWQKVTVGVAILGSAIALAASLIVGHLSFRYFERPIMRLKKQFTFVAAREDH